MERGVFPFILSRKDFLVLVVFIEESKHRFKDGNENVRAMCIHNRLEFEGNLG